MKVDSVGNIYCCGPGGVWIFPPTGNTYLDKILMPNNASASNCAWGDADKKTLYITSGSSVYKIRLASTTGVDKKQGGILPNNYKLFQNYPNPFNPSTVIGYQLPKAGFISLKIYDLLGNEVKTLVNEFQSAGIYNSQFSILDLPAARHGSQLTSGIYFYTLIAGNFTQTKKLILIK
jgi:hypothetical protein